VLVSYHYLASKRKAGFHFLAQAYQELGWEVVFVTAPISWLSYLRHDPRLEYPVRQEAGRLLEHGPGLRSYVLFTTYHPANLRLGVLNRLAAPLYARWPNVRLGRLADVVRAADLVVFESTPALLLFERFRLLNGRARYVYRVSDDLRLLEPHPLVLRRELDFAPRFDLVSASSQAIHRRFAHLANARVDAHAIDKQLFATRSPSPYSAPVNALFLGFWPIDEHFLATVSAQFPDVEFHVVGSRPTTQAPNVVAHGELPFADTVPFVQHASIGLHTVARRPGAESLTDTLKVVQFSYCGLPIVAPSFIESDRPNFVSYDPGDTASVGAAVARALALGRVAEAAGDVRSWQELAAALAA
jgi:2-beta-glucuronyltransferase